MTEWRLRVGLLALLALLPAAAVAQAGSGVSVRTFRYYRADTRQTLVTAFVEVPYLALVPTSTTGAGEVKYGVVVQITDSAGTRLDGAAWPGRARADLRSVGAAAVEILDFSLAPGKFRIEVTVTDSVSGQQLSTGSDLEAYRDAPLASDLMLSPGMRLASDGDTMPRAGERRWGNTLVTAATRLRLTPVRTKAYYLLEAYAAQDAPGTMAVQVADTAGRPLVRTRPTAVSVVAGGSVLKGQLDLAGLPAGSYTLTVHLELAGKAEDRTDRLVMADFGETMTREAERLEALKESDEGYFAVMNDDQLNEAKAPLVYLVGSQELRVWNQGLSVDAKRQFLTRFWQGRDPTPGTVRNETREAFYGLIAEANRTYGEGGRSPAPGWRSDRGRVFVKYGTPVDMLDRRVASGQSPPYVVWRYVKGKPLYFIFADRTGFGGYKLLASNDLGETSQPGFREILGTEALQDISRFLGIDLFLSSGGTGTNPTQ